MKAIYYILFLLMTVSVFAQEKMKPIASLSTFQERLKKEGARIHSIESEFTQEKYVDIFNEKIISKGHFYYKEPDKIRMEYNTPQAYLIIINGDKLNIAFEEYNNTLDLGSNQMMNELKDMISACMTGDFTAISSAYTLDYFETSSLYVVKIIPESDGLKESIFEITVSLDKKDMSVQRLHLAESTTDYTEFVFTNRKYNTLNNIDLFSY